MARDAAEPAVDADPWPPPVIDLDAVDAAGNRMWLTRQQAAAVAKVDEKTIRRWCKRYPIAVRLPSGRSIVYRPRLFAR